MIGRKIGSAFMYRPNMRTRIILRKICSIIFLIVSACMVKPIGNAVAEGDAGKAMAWIIFFLFGEFWALLSVMTPRYRMNLGQQELQQKKIVAKTVAGKKTSGLAIASLVLGILSVILGWIPFFGFILIIPTLVFGILALIKIKKGTASGRGMAIAGIVLGGIGLLFEILILAFVPS